MPEDREELIVKETLTEEFVVGGVVVAEEKIGAEIDIDVRESPEITVVLTTGARHNFVYHPKEEVGKLTAEAVKYFADHGKLDPSKSYELVLDGRKLEPRLTLKEAGIKPCDSLTLSPCDRPVDG